MATSNKVNIEFFLPEYTAIETVTWKCHVVDSTKCIYDMIVGRDLLTALGLDLKFSDSIIVGGKGSY